MKQWNDLNRVLIIDTNACGDFLKIIKQEGKNLKNHKFIKHFLNANSKNSVVNIKGLREENPCVKNGSKAETILRMLDLLKNYVNVVINEEYLDFTKKEAKKIWDNYKKDFPDFDDPWLVAKLLHSKPKHITYCLTEEKRFGQFMKNSGMRNKVEKIQYIKIKQIANNDTIYK